MAGSRSEILWRDGADRCDRSVRLPAGPPGDAEAAGAAVARRVRDLAGEVFPALRGYTVEVTAPASGETTGKIATNDFEASFRIWAGQDRSYGPDGQSHGCGTLSFEGEARIPSLGRAEKTCESIALICGAVGAVAFGALFFFLRRLALEALGAIVYPAAVVIAFPLAGAIAGAFLGRYVGAFVARLLVIGTERNEAVIAAADDWDAFVRKVSGLIDAAVPPR